MAVDLAHLPDDEEIVRRLGLLYPYAHGDAIQNVLDGLNWYRCKALHDEQELNRVQRELTAALESSHHNRIFGGSYGFSN